MSEYVYETRKLLLKLSGIPVVLEEGSGYTTRRILRRNLKLYELVTESVAASVKKLGEVTSVTPQHINELFMQDIDFLSVEAYRLNYGDDFVFKHQCFFCSFQDSYSLPLGEMEFKLPVCGGLPDPTVSITLPKTKKQIVMGLLTGENEALLMAGSSGQVDIIQGDFLSVRSIDGAPGFDFSDIAALPLSDLLYMRRARADLECGYDPNVDITCTKCGEKNTINVFAHRDFLFPLS